MLITQETQDKIDKLPLPLRVASNMLLDCLKNLVNNNCDEEEVQRTVEKAQLHAQGKYGKEDLINYDDACKLLGFSTNNRAGLKALLDKNGIKQVILNGQRIGFPRQKVEALLPKTKKQSFS